MPSNLPIIYLDFNPFVPLRGGGRCKAKGDEGKMMASAEKIIYQLQKGLSGPSNEILVSDGDLQVRVQLADWDRLGCLLEKLEIKLPNGHALNLDPVWIEKELTYLGEPLKIIELEKYKGQAILRSFPPRTEGEVISFFELVLDQFEGLSLIRYGYDRRHGVRAAIPTPLTRDSLERLLADLVNITSKN